MDDIYVWEPIPLNAIGTTCGACWAKGIGTMHSPAGDQHRAWAAMWDEDPDWRPEGAPESWRAW